MKNITAADLSVLKVKARLLGLPIVVFYKDLDGPSEVIWNTITKLSLFETSTKWMPHSTGDIADRLNSDADTDWRVHFQPDTDDEIPF